MEGFILFSKILIANRGEIAVRIIHACRELGIDTVAIYSTADKESLHVQLADEAVCVGPVQPQSSYLNMRSIFAACENTGAQAIHAGFGFLSENSQFAKMCGAFGLKFIGPSHEAIAMLGDKIVAKQTVKEAGVPVVEGSNGVVESFAEGLKIAKQLGFPIIVKATAGGGGKGIRIVKNESDLKSAMELARFEAKTNFGNDGIYIEKFIENPRHVEIQILGDEFGNVVHLGERDCSVQRKNQKLIEESPSPAVNEELRQKLGKAAVKAAKACGYSNAGTVEFLLDSSGQFYFMEMNTRIQVEHGITELETGIDLVKSQIKIASGEKLGFSQNDIKLTGHSIECRINAEVPEKGFMPSPGKIEDLYIPCGNGIRVDNAIYSGYTVLPYYDSMIAKVMAHAATRQEAIAKMIVALAEFIVSGIETNIDFQLSILRNADFQKGNVDINFLQRLGY